MRGGTVLGEMGLYTRQPRSAAAAAEEPTCLYKLTFEAFNEIEKDDPALAAEFHKFVVKSLSERLARANTEVSALMS